MQSAIRWHFQKDLKKRINFKEKSTKPIEKFKKINAKRKKNFAPAVFDDRSIRIARMKPTTRLNLPNGEFRRLMEQTPSPSVSFEKENRKRRSVNGKKSLNDLASLETTFVWFIARMITFTHACKVKQHIVDQQRDVSTRWEKWKDEKSTFTGSECESEPRLMSIGVASASERLFDSKNFRVERCERTFCLNYSSTFIFRFPIEPTQCISDW